MNTDAFSLLLVVVAIAFASVVVWRVRPSWDDETDERDDRDESDGENATATARVENGLPEGEEARSRALCDAGDARMARLGRRRDAAGFYLRAMRTSPTSVHVVDRVAAGLASMPRAMERLLFRHLGLGAWEGARRDAVARALEHVIALYDGPLKSPLRARAMRSALALVRGDATKASAATGFNPEERTPSAARADG